ncbi:MAG: TIGR03915 family putative DNA repair protein [Eubacteriales bacterium]|nr:TIGR03915 family putative DNA repair protein [Eubacteriales bacterium]
MTVYLCEDSFDGILCGVYDAWMGRKGHENVRLEIEGTRDPELFCVYETAVIQREKMQKVITAVRGKISEEAYEKIYVASLSGEEGRADAVYRFLIEGFRYGAGVLDMLHLPAVFEIFKLCRFVMNEGHLLIGFVRFASTKEGLLLSRIGPKNDVLPLLADHFANRLPQENWMIYDENRRKAVIHPEGKSWFILREGEEMWEERLSWETDEEEYQALWRIFHNTIAIPERLNERCQKTHLPLRYRPYMTEFT